MEPLNNNRLPQAEKPWNVIIKAVLSIVDVRVRGAETVTEYIVTLTATGTQYAKVLPAGTKKIEFISRGLNTVYYSFTGGNVAAGTPHKIWYGASGMRTISDIYLSGKTIYFAGTSAGDVVEMFVYT
jgi:hypothetical protein